MILDSTRNLSSTASSVMPKGLVQTKGIRMRIPVSILLAMSVLAAVPSSSLAAKRAPEVAEAVRSRCAERNLPASSVKQLLAPIARAAEQGLPAESVADKVLEGLAKGADPARIARAAEDVRVRLEGADEALRVAGIILSGAERRAELDRISLSIQTTDRQSVLELARQSHGAPTPALLEATRQLGQLRSRGVGNEAVPALGALARAGMAGELSRLHSLLDEYRAEGGQDTAAFFDEVRRRAEGHRGLGDLIDPFGEQADPLRRAFASQRKGSGAGEKKPSSDEPALERPGRSGSAPGLDPESHKRKEKDCALKKNPNACK